MEKSKEYYLAQTRAIAKKAGFEADVMEALDDLVKIKEGFLGRSLTVGEFREECSNALYEWSI